jgi:hypothetical protein
VDIYAVRRKNLKRLIAQYEPDGITNLSKKLGNKGSSYLSQMKAAHRPIGERTARKMEEKLKLTPGWFDQTDTAHIPVKPINVDTDVVMTATRLVAEELERTKRKLSPAKFSEVVAYVYEARAAGETVDIAKLLKLTV